MQKKSTKEGRVLRLVRHAKSSWKYDLQDVERPLKRKGIEDANLVATNLSNENFIPCLILSSPSVRTVKTAEIFINQLKLNKTQFEIRTKLYDFSGYDLIKTIKSTNDSIKDLMVFGHNNALTCFVNEFGNIPIENVVTSGYVEIFFNQSSWQNINRGITKRIVFPKGLKAKL